MALISLRAPTDPPIERSERWRKLAKEARDLANVMTLHDSRQDLLRVAEGYARLAEEAAASERTIQIYLRYSAKRPIEQKRKG